MLRPSFSTYEELDSNGKLVEMVLMHPSLFRTYLSNTSLDEIYNKRGGMFKFFAFNPQQLNIIKDLAVFTEKVGSNKVFMKPEEEQMSKKIVNIIENWLVNLKSSFNLEIVTAYAMNWPINSGLRSFILKTLDRSNQTPFKDREILPSDLAAYQNLHSDLHMTPIPLYLTAIRNGICHGRSKQDDFFDIRDHLPTVLIPGLIYLGQEVNRAAKVSGLKNIVHF